MNTPRQVLIYRAPKGKSDDRDPNGHDWDELTSIR